ncbi:hypothetical protein COCSADRAFT_208662 [Bipolaris sorokiniana ND90Pr]|uniref:Secreted protein n=1 Tax=Cochliobolus sativus (strain ND90Pr / ATCC 201652) TaxID=665912 RepID=M2SPZ3_COCSN|nr:uncharacterized protein COCSADRAFT_208662 [Bipolaris sorokiniana ND90Pr]EMD69308.1 hypothetical protein COCSADRAFT_208662 [Bipolaris sorokiniana ND90Pr]
MGKISPFGDWSLWFCAATTQQLAVAHCVPIPVQCEILTFHDLNGTYRRKFQVDVERSFPIVNGLPCDSLAGCLATSCTFHFDLI